MMDENHSFKTKATRQSLDQNSRVKWVMERALLHQLDPCRIDEFGYQAFDRHWNHRRQTRGMELVPHSSHAHQGAFPLKLKDRPSNMVVEFSSNFHDTSDQSCRQIFFSIIYQLVVSLFCKN